MIRSALKSQILVAVICCAQPFAHSADSLAKNEAKAEERMKEEKRKDEQSAKDYGNRVKVARFDSVWRAPRTEDIDVFQAGEAVANSHKVAAFLTFECAAHEEAQAIAGFITKSKDLGCDAVLILRFESPNANQSLPTLISPNDRRVFRANAIVYHSAK